MTGELSFGFLLLQTSLCLTLGLLGSYLWARKPARGHQILLICMVAGVVLPGMYMGVQHLGLGQLRNNPPDQGRHAEQLVARTTFIPAESLMLPVEFEPAPEITRTFVTPVNPVETEKVPLSPIPWILVGMGIWGSISCLLLTRLAIQFVLGLRLIQGRQSVEENSLTLALVTAQKQLNFNQPVTLCCSSQISSPVIWCWFKTPILLIQDTSHQTQPCKDWVGVFCHELAHARRFDHITNLWADLLCAALPWHPLVWWTRKRLIRLSEDVCDDWVLTQGHASTKYAESLLTLTSQKQLAFVPSIVGKDSTMKARIRRIIKGQISNPRPGTGWTCLLVTIALCSIVGMALAQPRPEEELRAMGETKARQESRDPIELGTIDTVGEPKVIDIAVIGRLNVLNRLLEQLTDQAAKTQQTLDQAKNDSDRQMHNVELDTLHEQLARIEKQIQQTKHPEEARAELRRYGAMTSTTRARPSQEQPVSSQGRWIPTTAPDEAENVSWRYELDNTQQTEQRVLRTRRKQIEAELKAVEPDLRRRYESGLITTEEMQGKLRTLKNEMELLDAQLGESTEHPKQQRVSYSVKHIPSYHEALKIIWPLIDQVGIISWTPDSMDLLATADEHRKIQQLLKEHDTPGTDARTKKTPASAQTVRSTRSSIASAQTNRLGSRPVPSSSTTTRGSTGQNLNAEVDDLRGQVKGLNDQMKEIRILLEKLVQERTLPSLYEDPLDQIDMKSH